MSTETLYQNATALARQGNLGAALALSPYALRHKGYHLTAQAGGGTELPDPVLQKFGLTLHREENPQSHDSPQDWRFALALRVGIALHIWDRVLAHLRERSSGGQKTIQHQGPMLACSEAFVRIAEVGSPGTELEFAL